MIGIIYTGEDQNTLIGEIKKQHDSSGVKPDIFVEPSLQQQFEYTIRDVVLTEEDVSLTANETFNEYTAKYDGYNITNSFNEYLKRQTK